MAQTDKVLVHPKPGVTVYLPGGVHGFDAAMSAGTGGIPMRADHAEALKDHLLTPAEKKARDDLAKAEAEERAAAASASAA